MYALLLLLLAIPSWSQTPSQAESVINIDNFEKCGFISRFTPNKLNPECFQALNNAVIDQDWSLLRRNGYAAYNAVPCTGIQPVRGLWPFFSTDGSQYLLIYSSGTLFSSIGDGVCTPITGLTGLSTTAEMSCVQANGYEWCANGFNYLFKTNVTSTTFVTAAPIGPYVGTFRNRILIGGVSGNLTNLYLSGELDGTDWALPTTITYSTSPAIIRINGTNDGLAITCLMGEFQNNFYIGRQYDLYGLSGYDLRDFAVRKVSEQIGCMENKSVQEVNNVLSWLSRRGIEGLTGTQINWLSYVIDPTIRAIITSFGNSQSFTVNGNNFTNGLLSGISSTINPGNLVVSTFSATDDIGADFSKGTFSSALTTTTVPGSLQISSSPVLIFNGDFEQGSAGSAPTLWSCTNNVTANCDNGGAPILAGTKSGQMNAQCIGDTTGVDAQVRILNTGNVTLISYSQTSDPTVLTGKTIDLTAYSTQTLKIQFFAFGGNGGNKQGTLTSSTFTAISSISYVATGYQSCADASVYGFRAIDNVTVNRFFPIGESSFTATFTSQIFDTGFSTPVGGPITVSSNVPGGTTLTYQIRSATSTNGVFDAFTTVGNQNRITETNRFYQYRSIFTTQVGTSTPRIDSVNLIAETTGYYITPCVTASGITSFGLLSVDAVNNGGSFTIGISTGNSCNAVTNPSGNFMTVTPNSIISVATSSFFAARIIFNIDSGTQTPILNNLTFNWNSGPSRPLVASSNYQNKYWLFYTTSTAVGAYNDHAVVYDQNQHWQLHDDITARSAAIYLNSLYIGDSQATGTVYLFDTGSADKGNPYSFSFKTPDLDGGDPMSNKQFSRAYLLVSAPTTSAQSSSLDCNYAIDGSTTTYSLGTVNLTEAAEIGGYFVAKLPFPSGSASRGNWVNMSCTNSGTQGPIRIHGIKIVYTKTDWK